MNEPEITLDYQTTVEIRVALSERRRRLIVNWAEAADQPARDLTNMTFWAERIRETIAAEERVTALRYEEVLRGDRACGGAL